MKKPFAKFISLFLLFLVYSVAVQAQDLIVIKENDSVHCRIQRIKGEHIYFTYVNADKVMKTLVPLSQVSSYVYGFYATPEVPVQPGEGYRDLPTFRFGANGGWSYRTAKLGDNIPSELKNYMKNLRSGVHYGLDACWYFTDRYGVGFKYSSYNSKNSIDNISATLPDGTIRYGVMSDDITIQFAGAMFSSRIFDDQWSNCLVSNIGLGYLGFMDKAVLIDEFTLKGSTFGVCLEIGYDFRISENFVLGFQAAYVAGVLTELDYSDASGTEHIELEEEQYEGLHRLDLSIGLRFIK